MLEHLAALKELRQLILSSWTTAGLDAVICPVAGFAGPLPLAPKASFTGMLSYANLTNVLGCPAGALPSGYRVDQNLDLRPLEQAVAKTPVRKTVAPNAEGVYMTEDEAYPTHSPWHRSMPGVSLRLVCTLFFLALCRIMNGREGRTMLGGNDVELTNICS
ncbi:unnamed protein product [Protopolystoma xenopodis]|uniref:Amidase domain-containing protein n=1 Tax=Protopolystoma xenopodis TaxID=117903 RepID=A0A448WGI3_9PLAT|nr:unnamed protein product [Protopolystoma xenopodis]